MTKIIMSPSTKTGSLILGIIFITIALFFLSVRANTPPSFESILNKNTNTNSTVEALKAPTVTIADPQKGPSKAPVTIVEFADYRCSHCADVSRTLNQIAASYPKDVRLVWKDFPFISPIELTLKAHEAARCAGKQNKYWEYHDMIFDNQNDLSDSLLVEMAKNLNLNLPLFETCVNNEETKPLVQKAFQEGQQIGIDGTPTIFVNGVKTSNVTKDLIEGLITK